MRNRGVKVLVLAVVAALGVALALSGAVGARSSKPQAKVGHPHNLLKANLSGAREVPGPGDPNGRGSALIRVLPRFGAVCFKVSWKNIADPTAGHIHRGVKGVAGPIVVTLFGTGTTGCADGLDATLLREIRRHPRRFYVNLHNNDFPNGAIRGQLKHTGHHRGQFKHD
jgi:CHRD domain-containing protein